MNKDDVLATVRAHEAELKRAGIVRDKRGGSASWRARAAVGSGTALRLSRGLGNWLRRGYDRIDPGVLWRTVTDDLPPLKAAAKEAVRSLETPGPEPR